MSKRSARRDASDATKHLPESWQTPRQATTTKRRPKAPRWSARRDAVRIRNHYHMHVDKIEHNKALSRVITGMAGDCIPTPQNHKFVEHLFCCSAKLVELG